MEKFSLGEALRYITTGFVFLGSLWYDSRPEAKALMDALGQVGIVAFSLAFGAVLYPVYRAFVYNWLMPILQDVTRRKSDSYRTYLKREYGVKKTADAVRLYVVLRDQHLKDAQRETDATIANVHLGYMSALILGSFGVRSAMMGPPTTSNWFLLTSAVVFLGTFRFEQRFQTDEHARFLAKCDSATIEAMAKKLGISVKESDPVAPAN